MSDQNDVAPATVGRGLIGILEQRRQEIASEQVLSLEVPRWTSPKVVIRFTPVDHETLTRGRIAVQTAMKNGDVKKQTQVDLDTNADLLIHACTEIVAILSTGEEVYLGPNNTPTRFDSDTAIALGMPPTSTARMVCKHLFLTEADMVMTAKKLGDWSGYREDAVDESVAGES